MILYWIIFILIIAYAWWYDCKKAIIVWLPAQVLFNSMVALKFSPPALTLNIAVNFLLPVIFVVKGLGKDSKRFNRSPFFFEPVLIAYILSYLLSMVVSKVTFGSFVNSMLKFFVTNFVMLYFFQKCINDKKDIELFTKTCVAVAILIVSLGLYETIFKDNPILDFVYHACPDPTSPENRDKMYYRPPSEGQYFQMRYGLARAYSFFGIHIAFGFTCANLAYFLGVMYRERVSFIKTKHLYWALVLSLVGTFLCNSKAPLVALMCFLFAIFTPKQVFNKKVFIFLVAGVLALIFLAPGYVDNFLSLFDEDLAEEGSGSSVEGRKEQFAVAIRLFAESPILGNGLGALGYFAKTGQSAGILGAESVWMQIGVERGLIGLLAYLYFYIYCYSYQKYIPNKILIPFFIGLLVYETATGLGRIVMYGGIIIVLRQYYKIKRQERNEARISDISPQ